MRARLLLGWLVGAVLVVGCETNQPSLQQQQVITLEFRATAAEVQEMWTYRVFEDSDQDGLPDDSTGDGVADEYLWCEPQAEYVGSEMPWSFSTQVDIVPAGGTDAVTVAREVNVNQSFARYDQSTGDNLTSNITPLFVTNRTGFCSLNQNILCNPDNLPTGTPPTTICEIEGAGICSASGLCSGDSSVSCEPDSPVDTCQNQGLGVCNDVPVTRKFVYDPIANRISGASEATLTAELNIAYITDPSAATTKGETGGRCPGQNLGPANVGGNPTPWSFVINKGDTVNVQARRFSQLPPGFAVISGPPPTDDPATVYISSEADPISASILVDGNPVGVTGSTATTPGDPGSFIDFFFTSR